MRKVDREAKAIRDTSRAMERRIHRDAGHDRDNLTRRGQKRNEVMSEMSGEKSPARLRRERMYKLYKRIPENSVMSPLARAVCMQTFRPYDVANLPFAVVQKNLPGALLDPEDSMPFQKGLLMSFRTTVTTSSSPTGVVAFNSAISMAGYRSTNSILRTSGGTTYATVTVPTAPATGLVETQATPKNPYTIPATGNDRQTVNALVLGQTVRIKVNWGSAVERSGVVVGGWVQKTTNDIGAALTLTNLTDRGYMQHSLALLDDDEQIVFHKPADALIINDATLADGFSDYSGPSTGGYIVFVGQGLNTTNPPSFSVEVDTCVFYWGYDVPTSKRIEYSQSAYDCAASCEANAGIQHFSSGNHDQEKYFEEKVRHEGVLHAALATGANLLKGAGKRIIADLKHEISGGAF